jgi:hypothetical protein
MLQSISWGQLAVALIIIFTFYYGYLAIRYAADLKNFTPKRKPTVLREEEKFATEPEEEVEEAGPLTAGSEAPAANNDAVFDRIEELVDRLKERIGQAAKENLMKGELAVELKTIVADYPDLRQSSYQSALNELVGYECIANGLTALTAQEIEELWLT